MHINITLLPRHAGIPIRTDAASTPFRPYHCLSGRKIGGTVRSPHVVSVSYIQKRRNKGTTKPLPTASVCRGLQIPSLLSAQPTYYPAPIPNSMHPLLTQSPVRPKFKSPLFLLSAVRQPDPPPPFCRHPFLYLRLLPTENYFLPGPQSLTSCTINHISSNSLLLSSHSLFIVAPDRIKMLRAEINASPVQGVGTKIWKSVMCYVISEYFKLHWFNYGKRKQKRSSLHLSIVIFNKMILRLLLRSNAALFLSCFTLDQCYFPSLHVVPLQPTSGRNKIKCRNISGMLTVKYEILIHL